MNRGRAAAGFRNSPDSRVRAMKSRAVVLYLLRVVGAFVGGAALLLLFVLACFIIFGFPDGVM